jgi:hypothetical protein
MTASIPFERLIQTIVSHPTYGPAMETAVGSLVPLVLDYHTHKGEESYCVSIRGRIENPVQLLTSGAETLNELVHIEGFGRSREDCLPLCEAFSKALCDHYQLATPPEIYLDGQPVNPST